jgi:hypothetical protein
VAEAEGSSGTQRKGNVHCWKLLPSNSSEHVTVGTSVCNSAILSVDTHCVKVYNKWSHQSKTHLYSHSIHVTIFYPLNIFPILKDVLPKNLLTNTKLIFYFIIFVSNCI